MTRNKRMRLARELASVLTATMATGAVCAAELRQEGADASSSAGLEEVIVTAQKRAESVMDVPTAINAIGGDRLESLNVNSLADMASYVPGLAVAAGGAPGYRTVVIRGINSGYYQTQGPLVATYVDDLPIGASLGGRPSLFGLDVNPYDIDRVEILKGPQGTLYGANTMGGLVKYSLRRPSLKTVEARFGADLQNVDGSSETGWSARGAVSFPIVTDRLALRVSGFHTSNPGYIDNSRLGTTDVNESTQSGGNATLLWQITDRFTLRAGVLAQETDAKNMAAVSFDGTTLQPLAGPFRTDSRFPESFEQSTRTYSVTLDWDFDFATLTSASGWSQISSTDTEDFTVPFGAYCAPRSLNATWTGCPNYPQAAYARFSFSPDVSKFVEELRLASPADQRFQWMLGGYYARDKVFEQQYLPALTSALQFADLLIDTYNKTLYKEAALFANITYSFTDRFDVSVGGRYSSYDVESCALRSDGILANGVVRCNKRPKEDISLWMANARFHPNDDTMLYVRAANSYRPGSGCRTYADGTPCGNPTLGLPGIVEPDKTTNYEVGIKTSLLENRLQLSTSLFFVDWSNIQLTQRAPSGFIYPGNGGTATSTGVELTAGYRLTQGLRLDLTVGYTDAKLTEDAPGAGGRDGDRLPGSPLWTGSLTAEYARPLGSAKTLLLGGGYRYRDEVVNQFPLSSGPPADPSVPIDAQSLVDAYAGLEMSSVTVKIYGTNIFDDRSYSGLLYLTDIQRPRFVPVQPRTIGLSVDYRF